MWSWLHHGSERRSQWEQRWYIPFDRHVEEAVRAIAVDEGLIESR